MMFSSVLLVGLGTGTFLSEYVGGIADDGEVSITFMLLE